MTDARLAAFLYLLMRDDVVPGRVEKLVLETEREEGVAFDLSDYTNKHLAEYAEELAKRLGE